jgi:hypothetical protein
LLCFLRLKYGWHKETNKKRAGDPRMVETTILIVFAVMPLAA